MSIDKKITRKLSAILSADVKGYSILMADDEIHTIDTLKTYRQIIVDFISEHSGRVVDSPGDNVLAEFRSVVEAVECAVKIQKRLNQKNSKYADDKKVQFRVGVNVGDVILDGDRIYGHGVNVAARIEGLADPGGVCISRNAYDHISDKLSFGYEYLGERSVKNIKRPVRVYKLLMADEDAGKLIGDKPKPLVKNWMLASIVVAAVAFTSVVILVYQNISKPDNEPAKVEEMSYPLFDKPSIAVLPFDNLSDDPEQEYFSDGMTDDIITDLSKVKDLLVISRNSTYTYKGVEKKIPEIAAELNVRYIVEGSVRKAGNQVRINAQLVDSATDHHVWADRYDGNYADVFDLQDQITQKIVSALAVKLTSSEQDQIERKYTSNIEAYDSFLKSMEHAYRLTPEDFGKAKQYFEEAIELDPNYTRAFAGLAAIYYKSYLFGWHRSLKVSKVEAAKRARHYLDIATRIPTALGYSVASDMNLHQRLHKEALYEAEQAIAMDPNDTAVHISMAQALIFSGSPKEAVDFIKSALRRDPRLPGVYLFYMGLAHLCLREIEQAVVSIERAIKYYPNVAFEIVLASAYAHLDRRNEAKAMLLKKFPYLPTISREEIKIGIREVLLRNMPFNKVEDTEFLLNGFIKAGLPEQPYEYYKILEENRLNRDEIKALVFGKTATGFIRWPPYQQYWATRSENGEAEYRGGTSGGPFEGKSWLEGDKLCNQWPKRRQGRKTCFPVFRNPDGSYEKKDEYFARLDYGLVAFSPLK